MHLRFKKYLIFTGFVFLKPAIKKIVIFFFKANLITSFIFLDSPDELRIIMPSPFSPSISNCLENISLCEISLLIAVIISAEFDNEKSFGFNFFLVDK